MTQAEGRCLINPLSHPGAPLELPFFLGEVQSVHLFQAPFGAPVAFRFGRQGEHRAGLAVGDSMTEGQTAGASDTPDTVVL